MVILDFLQISNILDKIKLYKNLKSLKFIILEKKNKKQYLSRNNKFNLN